MKKYEIVALCLLLAGVALQALAFIGEGSAAIRGAGAVGLFFGIAVEIVGLAIYENRNKQDE